MKQGTAMTVSGLVLGFGLAAASVRYLGAFLFGVEPFDPHDLCDRWRGAPGRGDRGVRDTRTTRRENRPHCRAQALKCRHELARRSRSGVHTPWGRSPTPASWRRCRSMRLRRLNRRAPTDNRRTMRKRRCAGWLCPGARRPPGATGSNARLSSNRRRPLHRFFAGLLLASPKSVAGVFCPRIPIGNPDCSPLLTMEKPRTRFQSNRRIELCKATLRLI